MVMGPGWGFFVSAVALSGCSDQTVAIKLLAKDCADQDLKDLNSARAEIIRTDGMVISKCFNINETLSGLKRFRQLMANNVTFDIPEEGTWTIRVLGFLSTDCSDVLLLCGKVTEIELPPPEEELELPLDCAPRLSVDKQAQLKKCLLNQN
jgi:hypothetical protein